MIFLRLVAAGGLIILGGEMYIESVRWLTPDNVVYFIAGAIVLLLYGAHIVKHET